MDRFQELLWDLGEIVDLPLHIDKNHACKLLLGEKLEVQMEMDTQGENLLIAAFISEIPPGRFRENVLKDALKVNSAYHTFGTFAYLEKSNSLILHHYLPVESLSGEQLAQYLEEFIEEAEEWRNALTNGSSAPVKYHSVNSNNTSPPFMR